MLWRGIVKFGASRYVRATSVFLERLIAYESNTNALLLAAIINHVANDTICPHTDCRLTDFPRTVLYCAHARDFLHVLSHTSSATPCFLGRDSTSLRQSTGLIFKRIDPCSHGRNTPEAPSRNSEPISPGRAAQPARPGSLGGFLCSGWLRLLHHITW